MDATDIPTQISFKSQVYACETVSSLNATLVSVGVSMPTTVAALNTRFRTPLVLGNTPKSSVGRGLCVSSGSSGSSGLLSWLYALWKSESDSSVVPIGERTREAREDVRTSDTASGGGTGVSAGAGAGEGAAAGGVGETVRAAFVGVATAWVLLTGSGVL